MILGNFKVFMLGFAAAASAHAVDFQTLLGQPASSRFTMNMGCEIDCGGGPKQRAIRRDFDPESWGLNRGNGGLWGLLGMELWDWGEQSCASHARQECGSLSGTRSFRLVKMQSGSWELNGAPRCESQRTLSPYSPEQKLERFNSDLSIDRPIVELQGLAGHLMKKGEKCRTRIPAKLCGGDCIELGEGGCQTLCTPDPLLKGDVAVCADDLVRKFSDAPASGTALSTLNLACRRYFLDSLRKNADGSRFMPAGCAAYRGDIDCASFVRAVRDSRYVEPAAKPGETTPGTLCPNCKGHRP